MKCTSCGTEIPSGRIACPECLTAVPASEIEQKEMLDNSKELEAAAIKTREKKIALIFFVINLPFIYLMWDEDFVFADRHPRTALGWMAFLVIMLNTVVAVVWTSRLAFARHKLSGKSFWPGKTKKD